MSTEHEPQIGDRVLVCRASQPTYSSYRYLGGPLPTIASERTRPAPRLGEDTARLLADLGYPKTRIDELAPPVSPTSTAETPHRRQENR